MLTQLTQSTTFPVTLAEAKLACKVTDTAEDTYISKLIAVACRLIESDTNVDIISKTWRLDLPEFPEGNRPIVIPRYPLVSVQSVKYYQGDILVTIDKDDYLVSTPFNRFGFVATSTSWQELTNHNSELDGVYPDAVQVSFTSGGTDERAWQAALLAVGNWFEHREAESEARLQTLGLGFDRLLDQMRIL